MAAPKQPQDHLPKTDDEKPAGWELMKPFDKVPVWEQTDLIAIVQPMVAATEGENDVNFASLDMRSLGELARKLRDYATDPEAYEAFVSGPGALGRAMTLGMAYVMQLGESERSAS